MPGPRRATGARAGRLKVGDRVRFTLVDQQIAGVIVEDRGPIGVGGRRLYTVRAEMDPTNELLLELPADELHAA